MNAPHPTVSPLRQRMLKDMRMRRLAPKTQTAYIRAVRRFAAYLGRPPDTATVEDPRSFQLHLVDQGTSPTTLKATITGLKVFCEITLDHAELTAKMQPVHVPRTLPVVLRRGEGRPGHAGSARKDRGARVRRRFGYRRIHDLLRTPFPGVTCTQTSDA